MGDDPLAGVLISSVSVLVRTAPGVVLANARTKGGPTRALRLVIGLFLLVQAPDQSGRVASSIPPAQTHRPGAGKESATLSS